ncbi:MAG: AbgT family transporter [Bacteroidetes bacterium]|nr:AbgT family transporter [Bacteroidota bacterium]
MGKDHKNPEEGSQEKNPETINSGTEINPKGKPQKKSWVDRFLNIIEVGGNALPHPATLFGILALLAILFSGICTWLGVEAVLPEGSYKPGDPNVVKPVNMLSVSGLHYILTSMVTNFTGFAPLGTVLVALLGIGVAEGSGLIGTGLRLLVLKAPARLLTLVLVFAGVLSNMASEIGYVLLVPLGAIIFLAVGRNPIAGMAAAFAGVSGGYSANLALGTVDPLLAGLSQEAAQSVVGFETYTVNPASNYYFMVVSTFLITILGTFVSEKIVEPRLGKYQGDIKAEEIKGLTKDEKRGLLYAFITVMIFSIICLIGLIPSDGFLRNLSVSPEESFLKSPFLKGIVAIIFLSAALAGIAYGIGAKTIKNDSDVMKGMGKSMESLGTYIVLVFFAAQFVAYFKYSNLGTIIAINGAEILEPLRDWPIPLMLGLVFISAFINLFMGSASAKWALMAPVFIPMFITLGYSPEFVQVAYRIGDSTTNIIAPMMSYFALIVAFVQQYDKKAGIGTVISTMLPYSIVFLIGWSIMLIIWIALDIPVGPGASMFLP